MIGRRNIIAVTPRMLLKHFMECRSVPFTIPEQEGVS